uniref:FAM65 N-terminal domain-containing protein n=1 Tax=Sinocyclocheilus rhinocerous TaxID=307959 RepID=A0A673L1B2_9TELE
HRLSSARSSLRTKVIAGKSPRIPSSSRVGSSIWGQQPEQVDRIFQALRKGLKYVQSLQYIRRLEFQISKVEELYESYCIQWRLCQGALNMKRAFSLSPSSRQSRESLLELNRNHRHSLEDMCAMEGELEILLGELQIKMKGLIGFARLCPGDQYEVLIRLGRQRWRIRGRIQTDDQQLWDEEEIVFLPHIHGNFEIKVTEVKGLSSILVGMVTCRSADFFTAWPQMMVVDITELGTIKLQLEVVWNPFDSSEVRPLTASTSRQSIHSRKGSVYSWTPPNTPSFTEKYFLVIFFLFFLPRIGSFSENTLKSIRLLSQDKTSPSSKDTGEGLVRHRGDGAVKPSLSTGVYSLDQALETHLSVCRVLLRVRNQSNQIIRQLATYIVTLCLHVCGCVSVLARAPKGIEVFWKGCCESDSLFCCSTDRFLRTLRKHYIHRVKAKQPGQADEVFSQLLHQVQCSCMMVSVTQCTTDRVTVFQLLVYLNRCSITDFGEHISLLSKEVYLIASLGSPKRRRALKKLKGKCISELQPTGRTLQLLAKLQTDANHKVASAATSCLSRASRSKSFRAKAVVHYTDLLRNSNMHVRHEACLALKCLKVSSAIKQQIVPSEWVYIDLLLLLIFMMLSKVTVKTYNVIILQNISILKGSYDAITSFPFSLECYKLFVHR